MAKSDQDCAQIIPEVSSGGALSECCFDVCDGGPTSKQQNPQRAQIPNHQQTLLLRLFHEVSPRRRVFFAPSNTGNLLIRPEPSPAHLYLHMAPLKTRHNQYLDWPSCHTYLYPTRRVPHHSFENPSFICSRQLEETLILAVGDLKSYLIP